MASVPSNTGPQRVAYLSPAESDVQIIKLPPHSLEAEQSVLGGLMLANEAWDRIADIVTMEDFYRHDHRLIYQHISKLIEANKPADVLTIAESLTLSGELNTAGGMQYIHSLAENTPSAANIRLYAEIVRERSIMRRLAQVGTEIADSAYTPAGRNARQLLDEAEARVFEIAEAGQRSGTGFMSMATLLTEVMQRLDELSQNPSAVTGVATGFVDLDDRTSGMQPGDLIIVAGRPSMGKAQPLDAQIKTLTGWKAMGALQVGDALASIDGEPSVVTGIHPQGQKEIFQVQFSDGRVAECCDEHLWRVYYREWPAPRVVSTARLREMLGRKRYHNRLWVDEIDGEFGHREALPIDPWLLGALIGDGTLVGPTPRFSTADGGMLDRLKESLGTGFGYSQSGKYDWRISFNHAEAKQAGVAVATLSHPRANPLTDQLNALGLYGLHSQDKFVPECYLSACREVRLALLQGLLDTDGWVEKWGSVRFSTVSWRLARDVQALARSLGAHATLSDKRTAYHYKGKKLEGRPSFVVNISHRSPKELFRLETKRARAPESFGRRKRLNIRAIVPSRVADAQCISVSHPSRLYLTNDYVPTHNTAFSLNIAEHVALAVKLPVLVFSMEMGGTQIAQRFLSSVSKVDQQKLRTGRLDSRDWDRLGTAMARLNDSPIQIDETPALNSLELRARARRMHRQYGGLGLIVVDYLQLMSSAMGGGGENRATEISEISRGLKALAKELKVPVVALSQLNRSLEQRPNKRPVMSDLRESGAIEQDADVIIFIYRDEVYNPESPDKGTAEIIIGKQRNGPIGTVRLTFLGQNTRFENFAGDPGYQGY